MIRGGPSYAEYRRRVQHPGENRGGPRSAIPTIRGGPSWNFPNLERDLLTIGAAFAAVVLGAGAVGAAVGAWIARRMGWRD